jgi:hypothetical protein
MELRPIPLAVLVPLVFMRCALELSSTYITFFGAGARLR